MEMDPFLEVMTSVCKEVSDICVHKYLMEMINRKRTSIKEESELWKELFNPDPILNIAAEKELCYYYLPIIVITANSFYLKYDELSLPELISEGNLILAETFFEIKKEGRQPKSFINFIINKVFGRYLSLLNEYDLIATPENYHEIKKILLNKELAFYNEFNIQAPMDFIIEEYAEDGYNRDIIIKNRRDNALSLLIEITRLSNELNIELDNNDFNGYNKEYIKHVVRCILRKAINPTEAIILENHYLREMTLNEIGEELNLSKERVRQLMDRALKKSKKYIKEQIDNI